MKFGVVVFPGSNCDQDLVDAISTGMQQEVVKLWHKDHDLQGCDFILLPGGFSYGDYLRSGAISRFSPIMQEVIQHANRGGYVMGICNGFQILTEAGLLPGALLRNINQKFICENVYIKPVTTNLLPTRLLDVNKAYKIPVAHGEGRYYADENTLKALQDNDQIMFEYCSNASDTGEIYNINGSLLNIAGVSNDKKNVFGMMPHPERAVDPELGNTDGRAIFESILELVNA
ncbi:phosphoribosylformylglycinamidine synthase subunit PurQ [Pontibacter diazotrophicus]|uniref:Phosphoribosylformylglycinamidine synthase subunit PurQ n=1 Tax=Pontibacter diazotrophicus TaxID=1400979 RepID=A0A3D8L725_9BACT|nr:phosphoribosylformylglycinamidine synthase subunit PurQ [Pontibacter diazotrophicus]RDV13215.1 phosphoribosylformylglycinamidine synthase subunit PurQ [Pontibacter diazotrophicus]